MPSGRRMVREEGNKALLDLTNLEIWINRDKFLTHFLQLWDATSSDGPTHAVLVGASQVLLSEAMVDRHEFLRFVLIGVCRCVRGNNSSYGWLCSYLTRPKTCEASCSVDHQVEFSHGHIVYCVGCQRLIE